MLGAKFYRTLATCSLGLLALGFLIGMGWFVFEKLSPRNAKAAKKEISREIVLPLVWKRYTVDLPQFKRIRITRLLDSPPPPGNPPARKIIIATENQVMWTGNSIELKDGPALSFCENWRRLPHSIVSRGQYQNNPYLVEFLRGEAVYLSVTVELYSPLPGYGSIEVPVGFGNRRMVSFANNDAAAIKLSTVLEQLINSSPIEAVK